MVIVYRSHTGFTKQYAEMLGQSTKMEVYSFESAPLDFGAEILYMGPVEAGHIVGLNRAYKKYRLAAVVGVGMSPMTKGAAERLQKSNYVRNTPLFYLQGGWAPKQVHWVQRSMVNLVTSGVRRELQAKGSHRTPEEQSYLEMLTDGGSCVSFENLDEIRSWLKTREETVTL